MSRRTTKQRRAARRRNHALRHRARVFRFSRGRIEISGIPSGTVGELQVLSAIEGAIATARLTGVGTTISWGHQP